MVGGFQVMPRLSAEEFAELDDRERAEVLAPVIDYSPEVRDTAIANAMWRKAHPGWRTPRVVDVRKVYFIAADRSGLVKIGVARDPAARLRQIAGMSPEPLRIAMVIDGGEAKEKELHREFSEHRSHGEWFHMQGAVLDWLRGAA